MSALPCASAGDARLSHGSGVPAHSVSDVYRHALLGRTWERTLARMPSKTGTILHITPRAYPWTQVG